LIWIKDMAGLRWRGLSQVSCAGVRSVE